jgi:hypothetical protein
VAHPWVFFVNNFVDHTLLNLEGGAHVLDWRLNGHPIWIPTFGATSGLLSTYLKVLSRTSKSTRTKALVSPYQLLIKMFSFSFYFCIYRSLFSHHILNPYNLKSIQIVCVFFYLTFIYACCYLISITYSSFVVDWLYHFILSSALFSCLQLVVSFHLFIVHRNFNTLIFDYLAADWKLSVKILDRMRLSYIVL